MAKHPLLAATVLLWLVVASAGRASTGSAENSIRLSDDTISAPVENLQVLISPAGLDLDTLKRDYADDWRNLESGNRHPGRGSLWLRFDVQNASTRDRNWWLMVAWPSFEHLQMHVSLANGELWSSRAVGDNYPLAERYIKHRDFLLPLNLPAGQAATVFLEIRSNDLAVVPLEIWDRGEFIASDQLNLLVLGAVFGSLGIMFLFNFSLFSILRDKAYLYYCLYVATVSAYLMAVTGVGLYYLWDGLPWFKERAMPLFACLSFVSAALFIRYFLELKRYGGWLIIGNNSVLAMWGLFMLAILGLQDSSLLLGALMNLAALISLVVATFTATYLWLRQQSISARIFVMAWSVLGFGTAVFVLMLQGVLPLNAFTRYSQMVGVVAEMAILSFALAHRINEAKMQQEAAHREALLLTKRISDERQARLQEHLRSLQMQRQLNEELENRVEQRTQALNDTMNALEQANAELIKLSATDPLTGVHNRRYLDETLASECKRAHRAAQPLAVLLVDLDHFKPINDTHGHGVGDRCLSLVAKALQEVVQRPGDLLARYGGEEFVFVLPNTDREQALQVAEKGRRAVANIRFEVAGTPVPLSVSVGVAAWIPREDNEPEAMLTAADQALYRAKNAGRNCVEAAEIEADTLPI